jgi:NAD(P)-dependent dehydrogenase (short-subunit alcohol dehydrogenase family)
MAFEMAGRVAFITGAGSGLGKAMAEALAGEGMKIFAVDVDGPALAALKEAFQARNVPIETAELDVTDRDAFEAAAEACVAAFGGVHVLCNNAGVYRGGPLDAMTYADWDWILGVNVGGVVNGLQAVLPRIKATGEGGHIVNTASMAGLTAGAGMGVYNASKFAVVGLSEALRADLAETDIGVSVLCPAMVDTDIVRSERIRPEALADPGSDAAAEDQIGRMRRAMAASIPPARIGELVAEGIREGHFWLLSHPEMRLPVEARQAELLEAFGTPGEEDLARLETLMGAMTPEAQSPS